MGGSVWLSAGAQNRRVRSPAYAAWRSADPSVDAGVCEVFIASSRSKGHAEAVIRFDTSIVGPASKDVLS